MKFFVVFALAVPGLAGNLKAADAPNSPLPDAVEHAHKVLWSRFVNQFGIINDYVGDLPTVEDCALGRPNAIGWWSPIENGPMFTGLYLPAVCERARRSGDSRDIEGARLLAQGLMTCASVSDVPGFVARGVGVDGKCHYPLSSDDQMHPWFYGLHAYLKSEIPTDSERKMITAKVIEVAGVLESTNWKVPCDGAFKGEFRGGFQGHLFRDAVRYLFMLRAMHEISGDSIWLERFEKALSERPPQSEKSRLEICAEGYPFDREAIRNIDQHLLWIYVGCQASLANLIAMEKDTDRNIYFRTGLEVNTENASPAIGAFKMFDNDDTKVFGNANWREVYSTWFPQPTQADAMKLSGIADKQRQGERKSYETRYVRNPLAAAAIVALSGDESGD